MTHEHQGVASKAGYVRFAEEWTALEANDVGVIKGEEENGLENVGTI